jgi:hypothetical protein
LSLRIEQRDHGSKPTFFGQGQFTNGVPEASRNLPLRPHFQSTTPQ